jgi:hypothetical protein
MLREAFQDLDLGPAGIQIELMSPIKDTIDKRTTNYLVRRGKKASNKVNKKKTSTQLKVHHN